MWVVINETPFAADRNWTRDKQGRHHFIVAVRATYDIDPRGALAVADQQEPPALAPAYLGEDGVSSLRWDTDLGPLKPGTDVIVNGHAHAPGRPVPELAVSLRVDGRQKVVSVRGENAYYSGALGLTTTAPRPFERMPIVYERAFGGFDTQHADPSKHRMDERNPIGVGFAISPAHLANRPGPNVVYPGTDPATTGPAGLGALASAWSPRRELAGTYDERWEATRKPLLPEDYDERFTLTAPRDQLAPGYLAGGARLELVHLTPDKLLKFELPATTIETTAHFGLDVRPFRARLASVIIEPDDRKLMLVWQASLPVKAAEVDYLDAVRVRMEAS